ncbi:MAG: crossover junction endodeoxyribonuclease RuvC [Pseudomonadota bacterium]
MSGVTILGIDPGLRVTGWGVVRANGARLEFIAAGSVGSDSSAKLADRLATLHAGLCSVLADVAPDEAAVEESFVNRDGAATLKLGHARGIALLVPAAAGLPVAEYAPNTVKKTVVGSGHAAKGQISHMVTRLLPQARAADHHAFDALAVAICHASHRRANAHLANKGVAA